MNVTKSFSVGAIFSRKMLQINYGWSSALDAAAEAHSIPPDSEAGFGGSPHGSSTPLFIPQ